MLLLSAPTFAQDDYELSYFLVRAKDGTVLAAQQADMPRTPASTMKVVTAIAAKQFLGLKYRFATQVEVDGRPRRGRLYGNLILRGSADPELDQAALDHLVDSLLKQGVRSVRGDLIVDPGPWSDPVYGSGWAWDDAGSTYSPEITGLSLDSGVVELDPKNLPSWIHRTSDQRVTVEITPGYAGAKVGGIPSDLAAPGMALRAGEVFKSALAAKGIDVRGKVREGSQSGKVIAVHWSRPLSKILKRALSKSDNLAMELLWRASGEAIPAKMKKAKFRQADGSGLSRYNLISARQFVELLLEEDWLKQHLPSAGEGTLRKRFPAHQRTRCITAKTGSMSNVSGLVGYLYPGTERECVFAILINGHLGTYKERKTIEDAIIEGWIHLL